MNNPPDLAGFLLKKQVTKSLIIYRFY